MAAAESRKPNDEAAPASIVRILSIDGGGIKGVIPIKVLQALKAETGKEPYELFDLICGTSIGGILAIMIGALKMKIDEVHAKFLHLSDEVFPHSSTFKSVLKLLFGKEMYSSCTLESALKNIIHDCGYDPELLLSDSKVQATVDGRPHVFAVATECSDPYLFRNYSGTTDGEHKGTNNVKIWQASRATSAAPTYFRPFKMDGKTFIDGGVGLNNPAAMALVELQRIPALSSRQAIALVSLGTGAGLKVETKIGLLGIATDLVDAATDADRVDEELTAFSLCNPSMFYWRLNPPFEMKNVAVDDVAAESKLIEVTVKYLADEDTAIIMKKIANVLS